MKRGFFYFATWAFFNIVSAQSMEQPNIVMIIADDLGYDFIEPYGNQQVKTPQISKLAQEGICFDNMFTSTAMCSPSRQQLLTGLYPVRNGAYTNHSFVHTGTRSIAHYLQHLGYKTAILGKRDFGDEHSFPFTFLGGKNTDNGKGQDIKIDNARDFINTTKDPFLLVIAPNQPHVPLNRGNAGLYPPDKITVPPGFVNTPATRNQLSKYFAEITYLDSLVGECLHLIDQSKKKQNTIIIFTSEQGGQFPFQKWTCYDGGLKTSFIVKWSGKIKAGVRSGVLLQYTDVVPTLIELAGGDSKEINTNNKSAENDMRLEGRSFANALKGDAKEIRDYVFGVHTTRGIINGSECYPVRSIRNKNYLYIRNLNYKESFKNVQTGTALFKSWLNASDSRDRERALFYQHRPAEELYDIIRDPYCLKNLVGDTSLSGTKQALNKALKNFMQQQGDKGIETEMQALSRQHRAANNNE